MAIFYKSLRVGKNGRQFWMYKFRTLKNGVDRTSTFVQPGQYTWCGRFLRKYRIDELPQILNWFKGDMALFGPRPEEPRSMNLIPEHIRNIILSVKPGLGDLSALHFMDEEKIVQLSDYPQRDYWLKIRPIKLVLQVFYIRNRCLLLNAAVVWMILKKLLKSVFEK